MLRRQISEDRPKTQPERKNKKCKFKRPKIIQECMSTKSFSKHERQHYTSKRFLGACIDNGAQKTVCGLKQARAYCARAKIPFSVRSSPFAFKFGNTVVNSLGTLEFRIPLPNNSYLPVIADIVDTDVTLLIGLDYLDKHDLLPDNLQNKLICEMHNWELPIIRRNGHMFIEWNVQTILFTKFELYRMHRNFFHPSLEKLFNVIKRAYPERCSPDVKKKLQ